MRGLLFLRSFHETPPRHIYAVCTPNPLSTQFTTATSSVVASHDNLGAVLYCDVNIHNNKINKVPASPLNVLSLPHIASQLYIEFFMSPNKRLVPPPLPLRVLRPIQRHQNWEPGTMNKCLGFKNRTHLFSMTLWDAPLPRLVPQLFHLVTL